MIDFSILSVLLTFFGAFSALEWWWLAFLLYLFVFDDFDEDAGDLEMSRYCG